MEFLESRQQVNDICCRRGEERERRIGLKKRHKTGIKIILTTQCTQLFLHSKNLILTLCDSDLWSGVHDVSLGT